MLCLLNLLIATITLPCHWHLCNTGFAPFDAAHVADAASLFWADFAIHLASSPEQPFIPADPTGVSASPAAVVAALAVVGLPNEGDAPPAAAGCSRSLTGSTLTLTARSACLLWVKQVRAVATVTAATAAAAAAGKPSDQAAAAAAAAGSSSGTAAVRPGSAGTVMVTQRLYDPRFPSSTDPETGEQLLLSLQPDEQQPLLAGQAYCHSVVITSTSPSEQQLDILVQVGSLALWYVFAAAP